MIDKSTQSRLYVKPLISICLLWLSGGALQTLHASSCDEPAARAVSIQGLVEVAAEGTTTWTEVGLNQTLCPGDRVRVGANSRAGFSLSNDTLLRLAENSSVSISAPEKPDSAWLELLEGIAHFISRVQRSFQVNTPYVNASVEGTEFTVESNPDRSAITVLEGRVKADNAQGEVILENGQKVVAKAGKAPQIEQVIDPLDAVQWTLYYPPISEAVLENLPSAIQKSVEAYRRGDIESALSDLAQATDSESDADLLVYRASLQLRVGGVVAARQDLAEALRLVPDHADSLALMSIISTVNNKRQQALEMAQKAVDVNPRGLSPLLALSYAQQAQFLLSDALGTALQATEATPDSVLAWTRLAQLHLMFRQLDAANEAASRAVEIAPDQSNTLTTLGFTNLIRLDLDIARQSFERAIALDQSASPLPRFGLGLIEIREGNIAVGRRELEIAAALDPGNTMIRSYLGKAYYEEKRNKRAATQFELAKQFDEHDPTPWFYNAILMQSENRPNEALDELQTSIDLNDNRAVYRSRFLLDQDEAARNASQARIYQDLGFEQLARVEAYKSLQISPQTHSAHRLLSDSYDGLAHHEKARMSELLQSQLLQPLNSNPIQPQLTASKLGILDGAGPSASGFSEYTSLFTRNGLDIQLNAIGGNNNTAGNDLILSGLHDKFAISLSQFHYETDGWRDNNDLTQNMFNAFLQISLTPSTSIQFEYRRRKAESGDLSFEFEPDFFSPVERNDLEHRAGRIGIHHQFASDGHFIASVINQDVLETITQDTSELIPLIPTPFGDFPGILDQIDHFTRDRVSRLTELQFIQPFHDHTFTLGGGRHSEDYTKTWRTQETLTVLLPVPPPLVVDGPSNLITEHPDPTFENVYLYSILSLPARISMTLGVTREEFENAFVKARQTNPKFGLTWEAMDNLTLRTVYLENIARPRLIEQTLEPTQVAGFNQLFDDTPGSEIVQFGFGVDAKLSKILSTGIEFNRRDLKVPFHALGTSGYIDEGRDEKRTRAYFNWAATDELSVNVSYEKEAFDRELFDPQDLTTQHIPVSLNYHLPIGLSIQAVGTHVDQEISRSGVTDQEDFWNLDAVIGYRLPKRYGKAEIIIKNLLDEEFKYYNMSFHTGDFLIPRFQPERQFFARFTINF